VRGLEEPELDSEQVLVLDDIKIDRKGKLAPFGGWKERHEGRRGETFLVNGMTETELEIRAGQMQRWRIINASSGRYALLSIGGQEFKILGTDGGLLPAPVTTDQVLLAPADRVDVAVGPFSEGEVLSLESLPYSRGMVKERGGKYATLKVGGPAPSRAKIPDRLRQIEPLASRGTPPNRTVLLSGRMSLRRGVDWQINREAHHRDEAVRVGELQVWDIVNSSGTDHPFHLHGFFFQVLEVNGEPPAFLSWEDTVNIPAKGRVCIAWIPDDRSGEWMYHCHILEHHAAGMMAHFLVVPPGGDITQKPSVHHGHH
jgi:FtsP/CotA-like multicopper oxidase with cupredoxin domain